MKTSFERDIDEKTFKNSITEHKYYDVLHTYFMVDNNLPVAIVSTARFKKNNQIGITHYLGINIKYYGKGLGKYMILYALHKLREEGYKIVEGESLLKYKKSLGIHFDFGFKPKEKIEYWNTPSNVNLISKIITRKKFNRLFKDYIASKSE